MQDRKALLTVLFLAIVVVAGIRANAQAHVVENQTTFVYADALNGSDSNSGTITSPFRTIQAAINKANTYNKASVGTKVIINPGIYREYVSIGNNGSTSAPLTVEAATTGTAIISASDVLTGWTQETPSIYSTTWTANLGMCPVPNAWPADFAPIASRAEMVIVDGIPLTQTMSYAQLIPGTFFVDETADKLYVSPGSSTNMATAMVEAAKRTQTLSVSGRTNVVLRGLVFRHAANCMNATSAAVNSSSNVLVDGIQALWNNWVGFGVFGSSDVTVQNSVANYNGGLGFSATKDQTTLFNFDESDYNNWRGAQAAYYDWAMGGTKLFQMRTTTVSNHFAYNNQAEGLWFDTDNKDILIDNATLSGNVQAGLQIERNEGPITLQNSHLCFSGQGANVLTSANVTIQNNTFYNNGGTNKFQGDIYIAGTAGGIVINDWQTHQAYDLFTTGMVLSGNTFQDSSAGQFVFGTYLGGTDWTSFSTTLNASNNTWYNSATTNAFRVPNGKTVNLAGWQNTVSSDYSSTWAPPTTSPVAACAAPTPSFTDFSVTVDNRSYTMSSGKAVAYVNVRSFGYGPVTLGVSGLPSGVGASFSQQSLVSGSATVTFTSSSAAVNQNVPITLWATSGSRVHSVTFYVQVIPFSTTQTTPTVTWPSPAAITYGTALNSTQLGASLSVAGACAYAPPSGTVLTPGTQTLTANCSPSDTVSYKTPGPATVSLIVNKAQLTITASSPSVGYGDAVPAITPLFSGFVNGDAIGSLSTAPTCTTSYTSGSAVGSTAATSCSGAVSANYSIHYVAGTVTVGVTKPSQTIAFSQPVTPVSYGASAILLSASSTSGLPVAFTGTAGVCTVSGNALSIIGAGACSVTASQTGNANYAAAPTVSRPITVNPAALVITASSPTVSYGDAVPTITAGFSGFVNGDSSASLTTTPRCSTTYTSTSSPGSSPATNCAAAIGANYSILYVAGTVTVNGKSKATPGVTAKPVFSIAPGTYNATQVITISDATSGATIYYTIDGSLPTINSARYSQPISISTTETIQAMAVASGSPSSIASASYTIDPNSSDFSVSSSLAELTLNAGQSGNATIAVTPSNGFHSAISFVCLGLPSGTSCSFSPSTVTPTGAGTATTLTLTTSVKTAELGPGSRSRFPTAVLSVTLCLVGWKRRRIQILLLLVLSVVGMTVLSGCGGGSNSTNAPPTQHITSVITVSAVAGTVQHDATIALTVN
jgi:Chitobiase/beta-hexosaminidase C-terminal domain/MBG domain (YGX type)/Right handed beta helix region